MNYCSIEKKEEKDFAEDLMRKKENKSV